MTTRERLLILAAALPASALAAAPTSAGPAPWPPTAPHPVELLLLLIGVPLIAWALRRARRPRIRID